MYRALVLGNDRQRKENCYSALSTDQTLNSPQFFHLIPSPPPALLPSTLASYFRKIFWRCKSDYVTTNTPCFPMLNFLPSFLISKDKIPNPHPGPQVLCGVALVSASDPTVLPLSPASGHSSWGSILPHHRALAHKAPFPWTHLPSPLCLMNLSSFSSQLKCFFPSEDSTVWLCIHKTVPCL